MATLGGAGFSPVAPGTVGSALTAVLWFVLQPSLTAQGIVLLILLGLGWWSSEVFAKKLNAKDPSIIVVDEAAGMWIALLAVPHNVWAVLGAFALFRFFDIVKRGPVKQAEALPGGLGIMADDVVAGLFARAVIALLLVFF